MKKLKILLLGGEGFIGRNLSWQLSRNCKCYSVGIKKSVFPERRDEYIESNPYKEKISNKYNAIIHLIDNKISPYFMLKEEMKLAENINLNFGCHLIIFSSAVIYSEPKSEYGARKKLLEKFYIEFCKKRHIPLTVFRLFNVYGPYQIPYRRGSLISNLIYNYLNKKYTEINDMDARRDFIYSQDILKFVEYALENNRQGVYDIDSGNFTTIQDIILLLEKKILRDTVLIKNINNKEKLNHQFANKKLLTSAKITGLEEGLEKTVQFFKENINIIRSQVE